MRHLIDSDIAVLVEKKATNVVQVNSLSDLPIPSGGKYVLAANTMYAINVSLNIATDYLECSNNTIITGTSSFISQIIYTGTGGAIRGTDVTVSFNRITFIANNAAGKVFDFSNAAKTKYFVLKDSVIASSTEAGLVSGYFVTAIDYINHIGNADGWQFEGNTHLILTDLLFDQTNAGKYIDCPTGTFEDIVISRCHFDVNVTVTGIDINAAAIVLSNGANILDNVLEGAGTLYTGFSVSDLKFNVKSNRGIPNFVSTGSMYWENQTGTMTLAASDGWKKITGNTSIASGLKRFSHTSPNRLTYIGKESKSIKVNVSLTAYYATGGAFISSIGIAKNGVIQMGSASGFTIYGADEPCSTNLQLDLVENDYIEVFIKKFIGASTNIVISFLNVQINELS